VGYTIKIVISILALCVSAINASINIYFIPDNSIDTSITNEVSEVTVDSVIAKYIEAVGGKEKLEAIVDKKNVLVAEVQGIELTLEIYQKTPNKYYQRMEAGDLLQETWFDGESGTQVTMGRKVPILGDQLAMMKVQAILNPQLNYDKLSIIPELNGIELIDGMQTYEIVLNLPSGKQWLQYYDIETGYLVKQISSVDTEQGSSAVTSTYKDYRQVDGLMFAHKITQSFGVQVFNLTLQSCEINTGLSDNLFEVD